MTDPSWSPTAPRRRGPRGAVWVLLGAAALLLVVAVAAAVVRLPYVVVGPGPVTPLDAEVLAVEGAPTYPHDGEVLFLTVSLSRERPNVYSVLRGWIDPAWDVHRESDFYGEEPSGDHLAMSVRLMEQSQIAARAVALEVLGYDVELESVGGFVQAVAPDGTARGALRLGDVVTAVDGVPTASAAEVGEQIRAHRPGEEIVVTVDRLEGRVDSVIEDVVVTVGERDGEPAVGIVIADYGETPDFPVTITLDTRQVTGPSAGLAFTLAIIDLMSPGDLTGGKQVAVTGTVGLDGRVGRVGGVGHKAEAARQAGAELLLVPADEVDEAERRAGDLEVVGVATVDEALAALAAAGGTLPEVGVAALAA